VTIQREVQAPVQKGQVLGRLEVKTSQRIVRKVSVVAVRSVRKTTVAELTWQYLWKIFA
jgi:hypothetical protein